MADFVAGIVAKVTSKETKGDSLVWNVCVDTDDNGEEWFGCGFEDPQVNEGDEIEFDTEQNGKFTNINIDTLVVDKAAPQRKSSNRGGRGNDGGSRGNTGRGNRGSSNSRGSSNRGSSRNSNSRSGNSQRGESKGRSQSRSPSRAAKPEPKPEVDWDRKERLIRLMACQNTAIHLVEVALANGAVTIPKKKADAFDAITALVEEEAKRLEDKYLDICDGCYDQGGDDQGGDYQDDIPE